MAQHAKWNFHPARDQLLAESHARPSTPVAAPHFATRIATMSGEAGVEIDREHMAKLCRKIGGAEPGPQARWCVLDGGTWRLRWERHTEVSTWTVFCQGRPSGRGQAFATTALDLLPSDWLDGLPGQVLVAAHVEIFAKVPVRLASHHLPFADADIVTSKIGTTGIEVWSDFRAGPDNFTRFILVQHEATAITMGRILQQVFEIETYRLLALLAFPLAGTTAHTLARLEKEVATAAMQVADDGSVAADRALLSRLAALAGEAEAMTGNTSYRFAAARAYQGLVQERLALLRETPVAGRPTIADFMERRLAPAMRTCEAVDQRQRDIIERIARTTQMLNTRVEVASEEINVGLLESMDRRSEEQLKLQQTVEGLSVAAISYYALGLILFFMEALSAAFGPFSAKAATGVTAPFVIVGVWLVLRRLRRK
jgi:uncharacterized membrane-anchored protein